MTPEQIIEEKYRKLYFALFDTGLMDWNGYLALMRMKKDEIDSLNTKTTCTIQNN